MCSLCVAVAQSGLTSGSSVASLFLLKTIGLFAFVFVNIRRLFSRRFFTSLLDEL